MRAGSNFWGSRHEWGFCWVLSSMVFSFRTVWGRWLKAFYFSELIFSGVMVMSGRFTRTAMLIGRDGLNILNMSKVAVFGLGGVGSYVVEGLARAGIGEFYLVDHDTVDITNINRQIHALNGTVGRPKTGLMSERIKQINPKARITAYQERYLPGRSKKLIPPELNYLVDAVDDVEAKTDLIVNAVHMDIPVVSAMGTGNRLDPGKFIVADISQTSTCPLARAVRKKLRTAGFSEGVKVVYSTESPVKAGKLFKTDHACLSGSDCMGSISFVPSVAGLIIASEVVKDLLSQIQ